MHIYVPMIMNSVHLPDSKYTNDYITLKLLTLINIICVGLLKVAFTFVKIQKYKQNKTLNL